MSFTTTVRTCPAGSGPSGVAPIAGKSGGPSSATYCATKGGLIRATEALRAELLGTGVSVSAVCPGFVREHGMYARHRDEADAPASRWIGETTTEKVAVAVLKAIDRDSPELIVSPGPFRLTALTELAPNLRTPLTNRLVGEQVRKMIRFHDEHTGRATT